MAKQDKQRLYIIVAVMAVAIVLLFLAKRGGLGGTAGNSTVINNGGSLSNGGGSVGFDLGDMPAIVYNGGEYNAGNQNFQKPCGLCFAGYTRNVLPAPVAPAPVVQEMIRYVSSQPIRLPSPAPSATMAWSNPEPPANKPWWDNCIAGRCF